MGTASNIVITKLTGFGSKTGEFQQIVRKEAANLAAGQVDEGYCKGVYLDWARRVIRGGRVAFSTHRIARHIRRSDKRLSR